MEKLRFGWPSKLSIFILPPLKHWLYGPYSFTDSVIILSVNYQSSFPVGLFFVLTQPAQPTIYTRGVTNRELSNKMRTVRDPCLWLKQLELEADKSWSQGVNLYCHIPVRYHWVAMNYETVENFIFINVLNWLAVGEDTACSWFT
jgi:hypothetical protein